MEFGPTNENLAFKRRKFSYICRNSLVLWKKTNNKTKIIQAVQVLCKKDAKIM